MKSDAYTPDSSAVSKKMGSHEGYYEEFTDGVSFNYIEDGKLVEIFASNEDVLSSLV